MGKVFILIQVLSLLIVRFYFTDQTRVSSTTGGENSVVQMLGSLYDSIENDYGAFPTRLYRAFRPKSGNCVKDLMVNIVCVVSIIVLLLLVAYDADAHVTDVDVYTILITHWGVAMS